MLQLTMFDTIPFSVLDKLSDTSRSCIERLIAQAKMETPDLSHYPISRLACVLVLLYECSGELRVLLTTRSKALRTHAGQTALPGGKVDESDKSLVDTAFREAYEEVALPRNCPDIYTICILEPFLSLHKLLVTPVIALLTDLSVLECLKASEKEVSRIFDHPLEALLDPTIVRDRPLAEKGSEDWPYETELHNTTDSVVAILGYTTYRMHRFRSVSSPIKGLTSDILIKVAEVAFGRSATYERYAPSQLHGYAGILRIVGDWGTLSHDLS